MQSVIVSSRHTVGSIWLYARGICVSLGLTIVACAPCTFIIIIIIIIIIITYYYHYYLLSLSLFLPALSWKTKNIRVMPRERPTQYDRKLISTPILCRPAPRTIPLQTPWNKGSPIQKCQVQLCIVLTVQHSYYNPVKTRVMTSKKQV